MTFKETFINNNPKYKWLSIWKEKETHQGSWKRYLTTIFTLVKI